MFEQSTEANVHRPGDLGERQDRGVAHAPLDDRHVTPVHASPISELFLRDIPIVSEVANAASDAFEKGMRSLWHAAMLAGCGLFVHGL
jgi:hypothetical protein